MATYSQSTAMRSIQTALTTSVTGAATTVYTPPAAANFVYAIVVPFQGTVNVASSTVFNFNITNATTGVVSPIASVTVATTTFTNFTLQINEPVMAVRRLCSDNGEDNVVVNGTNFYTWGGLKVTKGEAVTVNRIVGTAVGQFAFYVIEYYGIA